MTSRLFVGKEDSSLLLRMEWPYLKRYYSTITDHISMLWTLDVVFYRM